MSEDSYLQDEIKFLHHIIPIFKRPLKNATWTYAMRMNGQETFEIRIVQMSFRPELHMYECEQLKYREKGCCHDSLHEIITHYKNNQVNAWLRRNTRETRGVACC